MELDHLPRDPEPEAGADLTHIAMIDVDDKGSSATWGTTTATRSTRRRQRPKVPGQIDMKEARR
jgi:hypothetical protein